MGAHADRRVTDPQRRTQLQGSISLRCERAWSLGVLAVASAAAAVLEPPQASFWECAGAIAAVAAAATLLAALAARGEAERGLDSMLIAAAGQPRGEALRRRAERISSPRHRHRVARRLDALVERADRAPNRECFHAGLVRLHRWRVRRIARMLRRDVPVPVSALARVNRLLWDPAGPLVRRPADGERFAAWLRQIEVDMGLPARPRAASPVPVSSRRAVV